MASTETRAERIADACIHMIGIGAGLVAVSALITASALTLPGSTTTALSVYGAALVAMFTFSAAYNMNRLERLNGLLRRFDHAGIFLKIAGTYTPFTIVKMGGLVGFGLFGSVWAIALIGAIVRLAFSARSNGIFIVMYIALGWAGIFVIGPIIAALPTAALVLLGVGGFFYCSGVLFHLWERLPFQNAIWHLFVLLGTGCHFAAVVSATFFDGPATV